MNATVLDLRRNMKGVLAALNRHERVTLTYRGRKTAVIVPCDQKLVRCPINEHPAFGLDLTDALIAATAVEHSLAIHTGNDKQDRCIPSLELSVRNVAARRTRCNRFATVKAA